MRILITGGNGFIGSNLVKKLSQEYEDCKIYSLSRSNKRLKDLNLKNLHTINHDLLSEEMPKELPKNIDVIYHLAALSKTFLKKSEARKQFIENITLTSNLLKISENHGSKKIVFGSSVYVYSGTEERPFSENSSLLPEEFLGASKLSSELLLKAYSLSAKVDVFSLRLFTVYGHGSRENQFIPEVLRKFTTPNIEANFGNPEVTRDFIYISDVIRALILALESNTKGYNPINIASGKAISIRKAVEIIKKLLNSNKDISFDEKKTQSNYGDSNHSARIDLANKILGWEPKTDFENGMKKTIEKLLYKE